MNDQIRAQIPLEQSTCLPGLHLSLSVYAMELEALTLSNSRLHIFTFQNAALFFHTYLPLLAKESYTMPKLVH